MWMKPCANPCAWCRIRQASATIMVDTWRPVRSHGIVLADLQPKMAILASQRALRPAQAEFREDLDQMRDAFAEDAPAAPSAIWQPVACVARLVASVTTHAFHSGAKTLHSIQRFRRASFCRSAFRTYAFRSVACADLDTGETVSTMLALLPRRDAFLVKKLPGDAICFLRQRCRHKSA